MERLREVQKEVRSTPGVGRESGGSEVDPVGVKSVRKGESGTWEFDAHIKEIAFGFGGDLSGDVGVFLAAILPCSTIRSQVEEKRPVVSDEDGERIRGPDGRTHGKKISSEECWSRSRAFDDEVGVVEAEFNEHHARLMLRQVSGEAAKPLGAGVASHTGVDTASIGETAFHQQRLEY